MVYMAYNLVLFDRIQEKYLHVQGFSIPNHFWHGRGAQLHSKITVYASILTLDVEGSTLGIGLMTGTINCQFCGLGQNRNNNQVKLLALFSVQSRSLACGDQRSRYQNRRPCVQGR